MPYFKYGSFQLAVGETNLISHQKRRKYSPRGGRMSQVSTLHIRVEFYKSTTAELITAVNALEAGFLHDGSDAGLYYDDDTPTRHVLPSSNSVNGVQVVKLDYLKDDGAEVNVKRTADIILQAEYLQVETEIINFHEIVHMVGDTGPRYDIEETFYGPVAVIAALRTPKIIVQTGFKEAVTAYPLAPGPAYPGNEQRHRREISLYGPRRGIQTPIGYGVRWRYHMVLDVNAAAFPRSRP